MFKSGDVVKLKINGKKGKYLILHPTDIITKDCLQQMVYCNQDCAPLCYDSVVSKLNPKGLWKKTTSAGDMVCDYHAHRVYIKPVPWYK